MSFPFKAQCKALRDKAKANRGSFPGGFPSDRPIDYDDAWILAIQANKVEERCPGIYVSASEFGGQRPPRECHLEGDNIVFVTWVDTIERYQKSTETISDVMSWLGNLAFEEDLELSTYVAPDDKSQVLEVYPSLIRNFTDLHHLGVIGAQAGFRFRTVHHYNTY